MPILKGVVLGAVGAAAGAVIANLVGNATGAANTTEPAIALGYLLAVLGWLAGTGGYNMFITEWLGKPRPVENQKGFARYFRFNTDHKVVGVQYLVTFFSLLLVGGLFAMIIRAEHMGPTKTLVDANQYNYIMSMHGIVMVAVAVATITGGFANFLVPIMVGAEDVAFPRINALSYWIVPPVAVALLAAPLWGGFDAAWTAYPPLSEMNAQGQLLFLLAFITFGFASILGAVNILTTVAKLRAPGMTWGRLPIFVWSVFAASIISLTATQFVAAALFMVVLDRVFGLSFFNAAHGGKPVLYQHLFWFYSHPAVYIMGLPGFGIILEILPTFSRKPLFAYKWAAGSFLTIVGLGFVVWAHHQFVGGIEPDLQIPFMISTEMISVPTGMVFLAALGTIWLGRLWLTTPMLFALGFIFNFLIGGLTGIFLADVPTDIHLHDTYFVVAHFHYTIMGGEVFAIFAAAYYWFPKITGRMFNQKLGNLHFWWMFVSYNLTYIAMFQVGMQGLNRRQFDYNPAFTAGNQLTSIFAFMLGASFLLWVYVMVKGWLAGPKTVANPWKGFTLEWLAASPPPLENFEQQPVVVGTPYPYGLPHPVHATIGGEPVVVEEPAAGARRVAPAMRGAKSHG